jgi:hypothetical protein
MARYTIKKIGTDKEFIKYTSPSTILGLLSKGDNLLVWSAEMASNYIKNNSEYRTKGEDKAYITYGDRVFKDAVYAWKNKRDNTADLGSELHSLVETWINMKLRDENKDKFDDFLYYIKQKGIQLKTMFYQFLWWEKQNVKRYIESEKTVVDTELCYAGTLDFCYEGFDGKIYCVDLKTSNQIYKEHETQVVSYKYARESMKGVYIVHSNFGPEYDKRIEADLLTIDECAILNISRDYFHLHYKIIKDVEFKQKSFEALLVYFYTSAKRKLNNKRAKARA